VLRKSLTTKDSDSSLHLRSKYKEKDKSSECLDSDKVIAIKKSAKRTKFKSKTTNVTMQQSPHINPEAMRKSSMGAEKCRLTPTATIHSVDTNMYASMMTSSSS